MLTLGRPITYDRYVSMPHGPVLSQVYNLIVEETAPSGPSYWCAHITTEPATYEVALRGAPPRGALSAVQERVLDAVFDEFGAMGRWELVAYTHTLPEWCDPDGSFIPITLRELLLGGGIEDARGGGDRARADRRDGAGAAA